MAEAISRPRYFEGQILAARDLTGAVDYGRGQRQRHAARAHTWGILEGLELEKTEQRTASGIAYVDVVATPGAGIDGAGREVLLLEEARLSESEFLRSNVLVETDPEAYYPVLLRSVETEARSTELLGACRVGAAQSSRVVESAEIVFGRPGSAAALDDQVPPALGEESSSSASWSILLGYVQWNQDAQRFRETARAVDGIGRRYAGVVADVVQARGGSITLQTAERGQAGATLARLDEDEFSIGLQDGSGGVTKVFSVSSKGEVTAAGKPLGGGVRAESGLISDGMRVPLPSGVTEQAVVDGEVSLHIQVTPVIHQVPPLSGGLDPLLWSPSVCFVDTERRVHCRLRVLYDGIPPEEHPAFCSYHVIAVSGAPGAQGA